MRRFAAFLSALFAVVMLCAFAQPTEASAVTLTVGQRYTYDNFWSTHFTLDGEEAYCANPSKYAPPSGSYGTIEFGQFIHTSGRTQELRADLWFAYGGPGFDASMWPSRWYDGSAMTPDRYRALSHILIADTATDSGRSAMFGCSTGFKDWVAQNVIGFDWRNGNPINGNATGRQIANRQNEVPGEDQFNTFATATGPTYQYVVGFKYTPYGWLSLTKLSSDSAVTDGNGAYDLTGSQYGVFTDAACANRVAVLTVQDNSGRTDTVQLAPGTYYVKEIKAPTNGSYNINPNVLTVSLAAGQTLNQTLSGEHVEPLSDPFPLVVAKYDAATGQKSPQGDGTLAGARFRVSYYKGYSDNPSGDAFYTAVFETGADGVLRMATSDPVEGTWGYKNPNDPSANAIPLGTVVVEEVNASTGYLLNGNRMVAYVEPNGSGGSRLTPRVNWNKQAGIEADGTVSEQAVMGGIQVTKTDAATGQSIAQGDATLEGAQYTIWNRSDNPVRMKGSSTDVPSGAQGDTSDVSKVTTIETNAQGVASTDADALPYGTYEVRELEAPTGYDLNSDWYWLVEIREDGTVERQVMSDAAKTLIIDVRKYDADATDSVETGGVNQKYDVDTDHDAGFAQGDVVDLSGFTFDVVNRSAASVRWNGTDYAPGATVTTLTTDKTGYARVEGLPYGTYEVTETGTNDGYVMPGVRDDHDGVLLTEQATETFVLHGETGDVYVRAQEDEVKRGGVRVQKVDAETGLKNPQGDASLEGAVFTIWNESDHDVFVDNRWVKPDGVATTIVTDAEGVAQTNRFCLPVGTYRIAETTPPEGYFLNDDWEQTFSVTTEMNDGDVVDLTDAVCGDQVYRGGVEVAKRDAYTGDYLPSGEATLEGAVIGVYNDSDHPMTSDVDGDGKNETIPVGDLALTLTTDKDGHASSSADALPYGTYEVRELEAPTGYILNADWSETFELREDGAVYSATGYSMDVSETGAASGPGQAPAYDGTAVDEGERVPADEAADHKLPSNAKQDAEQVADTDTAGVETYATGLTSESGATVATGDAAHDRDNALTDQQEHAFADALTDRVSRNGYRFVKKCDETGEPMANVAFLITSNTTGEAHVVVTDENGIFDTAQLDPTVNTNANDAFLDRNADGTPVIEPGAELDPTAGVWFTGRADEQLAPDADLAPLPYDTYTVTELRCDANAGHELAEWTVILHKSDGTSIDHGTVDDLHVNLQTELMWSADGEGVAGDHVAPVAESVRLNDLVAYENLVPGTEYVLRGELYVLSDEGDDVTGEPIATGETVFTPDMTTGTEVVSFDVDSTELEGKTVVAYETVWEGADRLGWHEEAADEDQQVRFPSIGTTAEGAVRDEADATGSTVTVVDTVAYENVQPGIAYTLDAELHLKADDGSDAGVVTDAAGNPVTATATFVPEDESGTVDVTFEFAPDTALVEGADTVAFESLVRKGVELTSHADISDEGQDIHFPKLRTTATDASDGDHEAPAQSEVTVADEVRYENLVPGNEYTVTGELHLKGEDGSDAGVLEVPEGSPVTATATFTPEEPDGSVTLEFTFDASALAGRDVVAFEELGSEGVRLGSHADISDEGQTVHFPKVGTTLLGESGEHVSIADDGITLTDTVAYENVQPGAEYTVTGELHGRDADGADTGVVATSEATFTAPELTEDEAASGRQTVSGTVEVEFTFDASELAGTDVVAFEKLVSATGQVVAVHEDITDDGQTVELPRLGTQASPKTLLAGPGQDVVDTLAYENLRPGVDYEVTGYLVARDGDAPTDAVVDIQPVEPTDEPTDEVTDDATADEAVDEAVDEIDGHAVVATATAVISPTEPDGTFELTFEDVDLTGYEGRDLVAFEYLSVNGTDVAEHADIDDEEQTVHVPRIGTQATADGNKSVTADGKVTVDDEVSYENLNPGDTYALKGELHLKSDPETVVATAEAEFTPNEANGTQTVTFEFDATDMGGDAVVAFERVYAADTRLVAEHADIDDEAQTVSLETPPAPERPASQMPQLGGTVLTLIGLGGAAAAVVAGIALATRRKRA